MKRIIAVLTVSVVITWAGSVYADEAVCKNTDYSINALSNNLDAKAIACLDYLIDKDPSNGEAHFLKGKYCIKAGDYNCVRERFTASSAVSRHRTEITSLLESASRAQLTSGNVSGAATLYGVTPEFNRQEACNKFYTQGNATTPENGFNYYRMSAELCGPVNNQSIAKKYLDIAQQKEVSQRKPWLDKASAFVSWEQINKVFPAPEEKTVFQTTYVGKGTDDASHIIKTVEGGKELQNGDTIYVEGSQFLVGTNGKWEKCNGWIKMSNVMFPVGDSLPIVAEKGVQVTVKVIRMVRSY